MIKRFIPKNFNVPQKLKTDEFVLLPLTIQHNDKDFEAVKLSIDNEGKIDQAVTDLTKEENLINLAWHERETQLRRSFAYTVLTPDRSKCIGCVYIQSPNYIPNHIYPEQSDSTVDAEIYMWVTKAIYDKGLFQTLKKVVKEWIEKRWPFKNAAYPDYL